MVTKAEFDDFKEDIEGKLKKQNDDLVATINDRFDKLSKLIKNGDSESSDDDTGVSRATQGFDHSTKPVVSNSGSVAVNPGLFPIATRELSVQHTAAPTVSYSAAPMVSSATSTMQIPREMVLLTSDPPRSSGGFNNGGNQGGSSIEPDVVEIGPEFFPIVIADGEAPSEGTPGPRFNPAPRKPDLILFEDDGRSCLYKPTIRVYRSVERRRPRVYSRRTVVRVW